jgi:hypothetical protein
VGSFLLLTACVTDPPLEEYVLADAALTAARLSKADRFAPAYWIRAQKSYDTAQLHFRERNFEDAADEFRVAREHAEQAENAARLNQARSGGGPP